MAWNFYATVCPIGLIIPRSGDRHHIEVARSENITWHWFNKFLVNKTPLALKLDQAIFIKIPIREVEHTIHRNGRLSATLPRRTGGAQGKQNNGQPALQAGSPRRLILVPYGWSRGVWLKSSLVALV